MSAWDGFYLCLGKIVAYAVVALVVMMVIGGTRRGGDED
jgi:hypothetical protein